jgi:hypothetical protein
MLPAPMSAIFLRSGMTLLLRIASRNSNSGVAPRRRFAAARHFTCA